MKFQVNIFGEIPGCIEVEAEDAEEAKDEALFQVLDILDFEAQEIEAANEPSTPEAKEKRKDV